MSDTTSRLGMIEERDVPATMRDGVVLRADVFRPDASGEFPAILARTPYGKTGAVFDRFVRSGYVVMKQDTRGRYASDGHYIPFTETHTGDAEDGYDSVEWLAQQPYCNGRVGTMGASYDAWMQWRLAQLRPPHLVAMCACSIPLELTGVDWQGSFRAARRVKWWMVNMAPDIRKRAGLPGPHTPDEAARIWDEEDQQRWLHFMPWLDLPRHLPPGLAEYAEAWLKQPSRAVWNFRDAHEEVEVPNLDFTGWYDHCNDTLGHLPAMQRSARTEHARSQTKLIIGPWNHVGLGNRTCGEMDFGPSAALDREDVMLRWFDYWLKKLENGIPETPAVQYFVMGSNTWKASPTWPPENVQERVLYLAGADAPNVTTDSCGLQAQIPDEEPPDVYTYDPKNPVPTLWTRELFTEPADRRRVEDRADVLTYRTAPLDQDLEIVGYPRCILHAASSAPDTDFFAVVSHEFPDGPAVEVASGMVRARHRHSWDREEFLERGEIATLEIKLGATACRFLAGNRIRLDITSSDFPNFDRNHNTGMNDLATTELVTAEQSIYHSRDYPSHLVLPATVEE